MYGSPILIRDSRGPAHDVVVRADQPGPGRAPLSDEQALRIINSEIAALKAQFPGGHPVDQLLMRLAAQGLHQASLVTAQGF